MIRFGQAEDTADVLPAHASSVSDTGANTIVFGRPMDEARSSILTHVNGIESIVTPMRGLTPVSASSMGSTIIFGGSTKLNKHTIYDATSRKGYYGKSTPANGEASSSSSSKTAKPTRPRLDTGTKKAIRPDVTPVVVADGQGGVLTIGNLPEEEKAKITRLVDRLVELGKQLEEAQASLHIERAKHLTEMETSISQINATNEELAKLRLSSIEQREKYEAKEKLSLSYLKLYQSKVEELAAAATNAEKSSAATISAATSDVVSKLVRQQKDISQLETLCQSQRVTLETYELTRSRTQQAHDVAMAAATAEKQELLDEVSVLKSEIESYRRTAKVQQQSIESLSQQQATLQHEISSKDKDISDLKTQVIDLQEELQDTRRRCNEALTNKIFPHSGTSSASAAVDASSILESSSWMKLPPTDEEQQAPTKPKKPKRGVTTSQRGEATVIKASSTPPRSKSKSVGVLSFSRQSIDSTGSLSLSKQVQLTSTSTQTKVTPAAASRSSTSMKDKPIKPRIEREEYDSSLFHLLEHIEQRADTAS
jgi:hypothetical protein